QATSAAFRQPAQGPGPDVHRRLDFAPEGAVAGILAIEILDHDDRRLRTRVDVAVVVVLQRTLRRWGQARRSLRTDGRGTRVPDDRLHRGKAAKKRLRRVPARLRGQVESLERIAYGGRIERCQS